MHVSQNGRDELYLFKIVRAFVDQRVLEGDPNCSIIDPVIGDLRCKPAKY